MSTICWEDKAKTHGNLQVFPICEKTLFEPVVSRNTNQNFCHFSRYFRRSSSFMASQLFHLFFFFKTDLNYYVCMYVWIIRDEKGRIWKSCYMFYVMFVAFVQKFTFHVSIVEAVSIRWGQTLCPAPYILPCIHANYNTKAPPPPKKELTIPSLRI